MKTLRLVLVVKIVLTLGLWCVPLLGPLHLLEALGFPIPEPTIFLRLLAVAFGALVLDYAFGLREACRGVYPAATVWVGIASNGGAFIVLVIRAISGAWDSWGTLARWIMWMSTIATGSLTAGLAVFGPVARKRDLASTGAPRGQRPARPSTRLEEGSREKMTKR